MTQERSIVEGLMERVRALEQRAREPEQDAPRKGTRGQGRVYLRKYADRSIWWLEFWRDGKQVRESSGSTDREAALRLLGEKLGKVADGSFVPRSVRRVTFDELALLLIADYKANGRKSLRTATTSVEHLRAHIGGMRATSITSSDLTRYVAGRREEGAAAGTIHKELMALSGMFRLARKAGLGVGRPEFPTVEVHNARQGFFEEADLRAVLEHLEPWYRPVIEFLALTGWRKGEALGLQWRQVDWKAGTLRLEVGTTKNDEGRTFPFRALPALEQLLREQHDYTKQVQRERGAMVPQVFHHDGAPIRDFHDAWERARTRAGLPGRLIHDLRRTAVRNLERAGVPRSVAMKVTGHKTESIYLRYAIVNEADIAEGLGKLAALQARSRTFHARSARSDEPASGGGQP